MRRFGKQKSGVLMAGNLAPDVWLLEDVHRLQKQRIFYPEVYNQPGHLRRSGKMIESRVKVMQRVANLINRALLALLQSAIEQKRILFKKEPNLVARFQEVIVAGSRLFSRRENGNCFPGIERLYQFSCTHAQRRARIGVDEVRYD